MKTKEELAQLVAKHGIEKTNDAQIAKVDKKNKEMPSPPLHSLATLQASANRKWKYSPSKVLSLMQKLYERKLLSYPRTESNHITNAEFAYLKAKLSKYQQVANHAFEPAFLYPRKRYVDDAKVQEHYAIVPTKTIPTPAKLAGLRQDERNIYNEVLLTTLAMFAPTYKYEETNVHVDVKGLPFHATGKVELEKGWKALFAGKNTSAKTKDEEQLLPPLTQGENVIAEVKSKEDQTKPPSLYTEGQLIPLMKTAGKFVEGEEEQAILTEVTGIGTGATRANIIETLKNRDYIVVEKNRVRVTEKGMILCQAVQGNLLSKADMTAQWELFLKKVGQGEKQADTFIANIHAFVQNLLTEAPKSLGSIELNTPSEGAPSGSGIGNCPLCGEAVINKGRVYGCSGYSAKNCKFVLPKTLARKKLSEATAKKLLTSGKSGVLKGFKSKAGKSFSAALILKDGKIEFDFNQKAPVKRKAKRRPVKQNPTG